MNETFNPEQFTAKAQDQFRAQTQQAADFADRSVKTWSDLVTASTTMAFDTVIKNWDYSKSLRGSADEAIENTVRTQQRIASEMLQSWLGYTQTVQSNVTENIVRIGR